MRTIREFLATAEEGQRILATVTEEHQGDVYGYLIETAPPADPPASGAVWPDEIDHVRVLLTIALPQAPRSIYLSHRFRADCAVLSEGLGEVWGENGKEGNCFRHKSTTIHAPTLSGALAAATELAQAQMKKVRDVLRARDDRMALRDARLTAGMAS